MNDERHCIGSRSREGTNMKTPGPEMSTKTLTWSLSMLFRVDSLRIERKFRNTIDRIVYH